MVGGWVVDLVGSLRALLASGTVGMAILDRELRYIAINDVLAALNGHPAAAHPGRSVEEMIKPAVRPILAVLRQVVESGKAKTAARIEGELEAHVDVLPYHDADGQLVAVVVIVVDITAQRKAESALARQLAIARLISELSTGFIRLPASNIDEGIGVALRAIGEGLELDRANVSLLSDDLERFTMTHRWLGDDDSGGSPPLFQDVPMSTLPWAQARIRRGEDLVMNRLDELPPEAGAEHALFAQVGAQSGVVVPMTIGLRPIGFVGFVQSRRQRTWNDDELAAMRLAAQIFASAIDRKRTDEALRERLGFEHLLSGLSTRLISAPVEHIDAVIVDTLRAVVEEQKLGRAIVQLLNEPRTHFLPSYEACASGVDSFTKSMTGLPIAQFGWPLPQIAAGETVVVYRNDLPPQATSARMVFERDQGHFAALATVPLVIAGTVVGCIGFFLRAASNPLPEGFIQQLRLVGEMVANALARKRGEEARRLAFDELARLKASAERERDYLREEVGSAGDIVGDSPALRAALERVAAVAATDATVLLHGESGVGKELFARALAAGSRRANHALVKVNCASVPKDLFESEFFGHVRGAFTGAHKDREGRFELADGGTLFLDEVGDIPLDLQAKLLRVLQEGEFERVGDDRTRRVDVRIVAATHRDLAAEVAAGRFRQDLYYRLSVFPIEVPPLRARKADIRRLAEHFLAHFGRAMGRQGLTLDESQARVLEAYEWPGNIRELRHVIERAVILSRTPPLRLDLALPTAAAPAATPATRAASIMTDAELRTLERDNLVATLERVNWRVAGSGGAAELLGVRPSTLRDRMKALGIQRRT
jgi:transcriptional regulator with GAF, ATPase, and Fis domain